MPPLAKRYHVWLIGRLEPLVKMLLWLMQVHWHEPLKKAIGAAWLRCYNANKCRPQRQRAATRN